MLQKVLFNSGVNEHILTHAAQTLTSEEAKYCAILFDEMDIKEHGQCNV